MTYAKALVLSVGGGIGMYLAFPPTGAWFLMPLALGALYWCTREHGATVAGLSGLAWSLAFFLPHIEWISKSVGWIGPWVALATIESVFVAVWAIGNCWLTRWLKADISKTIVGAITWAGFEQLRGHMPWGGFPWGYAAFGQVDSPLANLAPYGGEVAVSALTFAIGALAFTAISTGLSLLARLGTVLVCIGLIIFPAAVPMPSASPEGTLTVGAVQGNIARPVEATYAEEGKVTGAHLAQTKALAEPVDLVLWGEQAADRDPRLNRTTGQMVGEAVRSVGVPIVVGAIRYQNGLRYNDHYVAYPDGSFSAPYTKQRPVPFGEYIPFRNILRNWFSDVDRIQTDMAPGAGPAILDVKGLKPVRLAEAICFEVAIDQIVRQGINAGGTLLAVPTNNSSFGFSAESTQQLQMSRFRALEYHRATAQVSTNGVSALILPDGTVAQQSQLFTADTLIAKLPLHSDITPAAKIGGRVQLAAMVLAASLWVISAAVVYTRKSRRNRA